MRLRLDGQCRAPRPLQVSVQFLFRVKASPRFAAAPHYIINDGKGVNLRGELGVYQVQCVKAGLQMCTSESWDLAEIYAQGLQKRVHDHNSAAATLLSIIAEVAGEQ